MDDKQKAEIQQMIQDSITSDASSSQFNITPPSYHTHSGLDSIKVSAKNLIYNDKVLTGLIITPGPIGRITINLGISNPTEIKCFGIARNVLSGTPTQKTIINGVAELGNCFYQPTANIPTDATNIVQTTSGTYFDNTSGAWIPRVFILPSYLAVADSNNPTTVAYLKVVSFDNSSITFEYFATTDWSLSVDLIIT